MEHCDLCGKPLTLGEWPFCPHGRSTLAVIPDDVPGGFIAENGFDQPTRFDSHSAHERALAANGYEIRAKHAGEHDKILSRWDTVDLDAARALATRNAEAQHAKVVAQQLEPAPITVTEGEVFTAEELSLE